MCREPRWASIPTTRERRCARVPRGSDVRHTQVRLVCPDGRRIDQSAAPGLRWRGGRMTSHALLLTDLVDSTALVERLGHAQATELLTAHDRLARSLLAEHHGREIDRADGFFMLFSSTGDACRFAL